MEGNEKIKIIAAIITLAVSTLLLSSCGGGGEIIAYSPDTNISVVINELESTASDRVAYSEIVSAIKAQIGTKCKSITDDLRQSNFEIVIGETNREVTRLAKEYLDRHAIIDGDTESYVFYYKDNAIAIMATSEFSMEIAAKKFVESYITSDTLVVKNNMLVFEEFSKSAYQAAEDEKITAAENYTWEHRWDALNSVIGKDGTDAVKRLYEFWGTEWLEWAISLYDPDFGGFYYSASARDYIGFSPDIESTAQILGMFKTYGLCNWYAGYWGNAFPAEFREALANFVKPLQSEKDGYFYHPQWGENISVAAKGRHLDQALFILGVAGETTLYPSPLQRQNSAMGESTSDVIAAFMDTEEHENSIVYTASTLPSYMQSEQAMLAYLEDLRADLTDASTGVLNSYNLGHTLSSQSSQIRASGLAGFVCDWLDDIQNPETGLWEMLTDDPDSGYNALSGVVKLAGVYSAADRPFDYADKMVDTAIEVILNPRPAAHVCYIFNPIGAFASILDSMKATGNDISEARQKVYQNLPAMIDATIEKQTVFKKEMGSFSYLPDHSDPASQGLRMSLGLYEGDVNATAVSIEYVGASLFDLLGVAPVPMFRYEDFKHFCDEISDMSPPVKGDLVLELLDFEDGYIPDRLTVPTEVPDLEVEIADDQKGNDDGGKALLINRGSGSTSAVFSVNADTTIEPTCTTMSLDMNFLSSENQGFLFSLYIRNESKRRVGYELQFNVLGDTIAVHEHSGNTYRQTPLFTVAMGEWFNLSIEYYPISSTEMRAKIYLNGECVHISDQLYFNSYSPGVVFNGMNRLHFNCFRGNKASVMIDNIECNHDATKTFDSSDYDTSE